MAIMFKLVVICGCLAALANGGVISGGLIGTTGPTGLALQPAAVSLQPAGVSLPAVATTSSNIIRGIGNLGAISAYSKSVDTAFSSVRKADVRINNPGVAGILTATSPALAAGPLTTITGPGLTASQSIAVAPGSAYATAVASPSVATSALGLGLNGLALNNVNGLALNTVNGLALNGVNGLGLNSVNGLALNGVNGLGLNSVNGLALNGLNGLALNGVNGLALNGVNGLALNGVNGLALNGVNDIALNGYGLGLSGLARGTVVL